jgi:hypothetical protein
MDATRRSSNNNTAISVTPSQISCVNHLSVLGRERGSSMSMRDTLKNARTSKQLLSLPVLLLLDSVSRTRSIVDTSETLPLPILPDSWQSTGQTIPDGTIISCANHYHTTLQFLSSTTQVVQTCAVRHEQVPSSLRYTQDADRRLALSSWRRLRVNNLGKHHCKISDICLQLATIARLTKSSVEL